GRPRAPIPWQYPTINRPGSIRGSIGPCRRMRPPQPPRRTSRAPIRGRSLTINRHGSIRGSSSSETKSIRAERRNNRAGAILRPRVTAEIGDVFGARFPVGVALPFFCSAGLLVPLAHTDQEVALRTVGV